MQAFVAFLMGFLSVGEGISLSRQLPFLGPVKKFDMCCRGCPCNGEAPPPIPADVISPAPAPASPSVHKIHPIVGSICGGTLFTVYGSLFSHNPHENAVYMDGKPCIVISSSDTEITCRTPAFADTIQTQTDMHVASLSVTVEGASIPVPADLVFTYEGASTPMVSSFGPNSGQGGDLVTFEGANFGGQIEISIGKYPCEVKRHSDLFVQCVPTPACTGLADLLFYVEGKGYACPGPKSPPMKFLYSLSVLSARPEAMDGPSSGSFGGGGSLVVVGQGFCDSDVVTLCDTSVCVKTSATVPDPMQFHEGNPGFQTFTCRPGKMHDPDNANLLMTPDGPHVGHVRYKNGPVVIAPEQKTSNLAPDHPCYTPLPKESNKTCHLTVSAAAGALKASIKDVWTYSHQMTPEIVKVVRGPQGGGHIQISGTSLKVGPEKPIVEVGGAPCVVAIATAEKIDCHDSTTPPEGAIVTVYVPGFGDAVPAAEGVDLVPQLPPVMKESPAPAAAPPLAAD